MILPFPKTQKKSDLDARHRSPPLSRTPIMGASRKLQGEIDRVLKKVQEGVDVFDGIWNKVYDTENANQKEKFEADLKKEIKKLQRYRDQIKTWIQSSEIKDKKALLDARKCIEREMERFKVCEKETKTKAFSKEGLGQQPKTDPKEKAKSETRDWINNVVGELDTQIDHFEAEMEGLSVKKGKTRPPRLTHLDTSIARHKAHIMKLETILRLLDNDELSPEQVNEVKDLLEDYVERNQDDFDEFSDVDNLYSSLPLDKVDALEDLVAVGPSALVKGVTSVSSAGAALGLKTSLATSPSHVTNTSALDQLEDTASQDSNFDAPPRTPTSKNTALSPSASSTSSGIVSVSPTGVGPVAGTDTVTSHGLAGGATTPSVLSGSGSDMVMEISNSASVPSSIKNDDIGSIPGRRSSPSLTEIGLSRGIGRGSLVGMGSSQSSYVPLSPGNGFPSNGALGTASGMTDITKRNVVGADDGSQSLASPLTSRLQVQQISKVNDATSNDSNAVGESALLGGRVFSPSVVSGVQWRPPSANSFPNQNEMFRVRTEIAPDQREQFLQRYQQVQQGAHSTLLGMPKLGGGTHTQYTLQQQSSPVLQQSTSLSNQVGRLGLGVQSLGGISGMSSSSLTQQNAMHPQSLIPPGLKDVTDSGIVKIEDQQQPNLDDDSKTDPSGNQVFKKNLLIEDDSKTPAATDLPVGGPSSLSETSQASRDVDLSPGQPLQLNQPSGSLGVIGRRSVSDLGAIGDNLSASNASSGGVHDHVYNLQLLDAAYCKLPQPKDSERPKSYIPKHPAVTPLSFPQAPAPIFDNPAFWERLGGDNFGTDILFFAFYYQQNTYQQYLAARELKRHSWRYHRKYNTWFQRHEEPLITNEEFEQGTYVYFDYQVPNEESKQGWCQRIKTEFTFEYSFLEDELV